MVWFMDILIKNLPMEPFLNAALWIIKAGVLGYIPSLFNTSLMILCLWVSLKLNAFSILFCGTTNLIYWRHDLFLWFSGREGARGKEITGDNGREQ